MKKYIYFIVVGMLLSCCSVNDTKEIVLKIGSLSITRYEFERSKNIEFSGKNSEDQKQTTLSNWKKNYLEKYLIIADAYTKRYDTIAGIKKKVEKMSNLMMVQQYGYLWQATVSPIVDKMRLSNKENEPKRKKVFYFDYIFCYQLNDLLHVTNGDTIFEDVSKFNQLKSKCNSFNSFRTGYISLQWPFLSFWDYKERLFQMKPGEVTSLLNIDGVYVIFYLDHIEEIELSSKEITTMQTELQIGIEKEIDDKKTKEIEINCTPVLFDDNITKLSEFISCDHSVTDFTDDLKLARYNLNGREKVLNISMFKEYYNDLPFKTNIGNKKDLIDFIRQFYYDDYLNDEALKLGIYKQDTFLLDKKMYLNGLLYGEYIKRNIMNKIAEADSSEAFEYYKKHPHEFAEIDTLDVALYFFDNKIDAINGIQDSLLQKGQCNLKVDGILQYLPKIKIGVKSNDYPKPFIKIITEQKVGTLSSLPVEFDNKYVLVFKKEEKRKVNKFESVQNQIKLKIEMDKVEELRNAIVYELGEKYKISINKID